jgi:hypothetical protein
MTRSAIRRQAACAATCLLGLVLSSLSECPAGDWSRFRGPNGSGVSPDTGVPLQWSETENLKWKTELPGRGVSCPIVVGDRVFVTCYSGYGMPGDSPGEMSDLKRHLVCVDRRTGEVAWTATVPAALPEDPYSPPGVTAHGYASHTPVSDGERIYAFFGKSGLYAYDLSGKELWHSAVGAESGPQRWGSAASPVVYEDLVIVNASDEGEAMVAYDRMTGEEKWRAEASGLSGSWSTPILVDSDTGTELIVAVPREIWAFDPERGKLKWYSKGNDDDTLCHSVVSADGVVYSIGGRGGDSIAVKAGGKGDVSKTHTVWEGRAQGRFGSPVLHEGYLYSVSGGVASCYNAQTGERVFQARLASGEPVADDQLAGGRPGGGFGGRPGDGPGGPGRGPGGPGGGPGGPGGPGGGPGGGRGGFGGRGGGMRGQDYASPVLADGRIYCTTKAGTFYVIAAKPEFELLATNSLTSDASGFDATPAISDGDLFIRSHTHLYCIGQK